MEAHLLSNQGFQNVSSRIIPRSIVRKDCWVFPTFIWYIWPKEQTKSRALTTLFYPVVTSLQLVNNRSLKHSKSFILAWFAKNFEHLISEKPLAFGVRWIFSELKVVSGRIEENLLTLASYHLCNRAVFVTSEALHSFVGLEMETKRS